MADLYTGKYLDGAGLDILWKKIKSDFAPAKNYAVLGEANTFEGVNTFTNAAGVTAKKFVVDGGTNSQLLLADGTTKATTDFATAGHNHDTVYAKLGSTNTFKETNKFEKAVSIGGSDVDLLETINLTVTGAGLFTGYVSAAGFKVTGKTGFLKANGTVDTNIYALSDHNHDEAYAPLDHNHDTIYAKLHGDNNFDGANTFTHVDGITATKFVMSGGKGTKFLLDNGTTKLVSEFATLGGANTFTNVAGVTATKFVKSDGTASQLLLANGEVKNVADFAVSKNYAVRGEANTFTEKNEFTHADGVEAKKFVVTGGTNANLLLANGEFKPVSDLATTDALTAATGRISTIESNYIKKDGSVAMTGALQATSITLSTAITADAQATTKKYVDDKVSNAITALNNVIKLKGSVGTDPVALPASAELGDAYVVSKAGEYAGEACEVGDMIVCTKASPLAWTIIQRNIPGVLSTDDLNKILV